MEIINLHIKINDTKAYKKVTCDSVCINDTVVKLIKNKNFTYFIYPQWPITD